MKEQFIELETAILAKEAGFKAITPNFWLTGYYPDPRSCNTNQPRDWNSIDDSKDEDKRYAQPTQAVLQRWLRDEHNILVYLMWYDDKFTEARWSIYVHRKGEYHQYVAGDVDYEKGLESGLSTGLTLLLGNRARVQGLEEKYEFEKE